MDPLTIALIGSTVVGGYNAITARRQAKKDREKERKYQDDWKHYEIDQNRKNWEMQNSYNSPQQQMTRLRQAGLNPNLVYGKGADNTAGSISNATSNQGFNNQLPPTQLPDPGELFGQYADVKMKQAQTDNLAQNVSTSKAEETLKNANTAKIMQDTAKSKFDLDQAMALRDQVIDKARLDNQLTRSNIYKTDVGTQIAIEGNERAQISQQMAQQMQAQNIKTIEQNRQKTTQELLNMVLDNEINTIKKATSQEDFNNLSMKYDLLREKIQKAAADGTLSKLEAEAMESMGKNTPQYINWILRILMNK